MTKRVKNIGIRKEKLVVLPLLIIMAFKITNKNLRRAVNHRKSATVLRNSFRTDTRKIKSREMKMKADANYETGPTFFGVLEERTSSGSVVIPEWTLGEGPGRFFLFIRYHWCMGDNSLFLGRVALETSQN